MDNSSRRLACFELWGGNRKTVQPVELPGLRGWVYSDPFDPAAGGGDVHYVSVCSRGMVSRIALADVAGHGPSASSVADRLRGVLQKHTDSWDQSVLMQELNNAFREGSVGVQYATAAVLGFYVQTSELLFTNAGHPPAFWYRARERAWEVLEDATRHAQEIEGLPLGLIPGTNYSQAAVKLCSNDILILYTDGITEAMDGTGRRLGQEGLLELVRHLPTDSPLETGQALLSGVRAFRGRTPRRDDETVVVVQRVPGGY